MLVYPQLPTGAVTQFPARKRRNPRTIVNVLPDGSCVKLADRPGEITEWQLQYADLSDDELSMLSGFFEAVEGSLNIFTFLDPTDNLLAWSGQLGQSAWSKDPFVTVSGGLADPLGGTNAWHIQNSGAGTQRLSQTLSAPADYLYCLSLYAKTSGSPVMVTLIRGTDRATLPVGPAWVRLTSAGRGSGNAESMIFGIEVPAGAALDIFGLQVEPQASPSFYKASTTGGVYQNASLRDDALGLTATDVNHHSATVNIIHGNR